MTLSCEDRKFKPTEWRKHEPAAFKVVNCNCWGKNFNIYSSLLGYIFNYAQCVKLKCSVFINTLGKVTQFNKLP